MADKRVRDEWRTKGFGTNGGRTLAHLTRGRGDALRSMDIRSEDGDETACRSLAVFSREHCERFFARAARVSVHLGDHIEDTQTRTLSGRSSDDLDDAIARRQAQAQLII
eukprot:6353688-Prymnesium_polylepis.3